MRKSWGAAVAAAVLITGGGLANAMDYRIGINARSDGSWSPFAYRYVDPTDEQAEEAHVIEIDGKPAVYNDGFRNIPVGDAQILDPDNKGYAGAYEDGFALWGGGLLVRRFEPMFQATSNNGAFAFGARFNIKNKDMETFNGNGWSVWLDYKQFEMKAASTGTLGWGGYVSTGGNFIKSTSALYAWLMADSQYIYFKHYKKGNDDDYNFFGYQTANAGLGVENITDKNIAFGIQWTQKLRGSDTLNVRLVNMHDFSAGDAGYRAGQDYDALYPVGWNIQANYRMPTWTFSGTYKIRAANEMNSSTYEDYSGKYDMPTAFDMSGHVGVATSIIPGVSLSVGYAFIGEDVGNSYESAVSSEAGAPTYSHEFWGHNFALSAGWKISSWSFNFDTTTTLMLLSEYMKEKSSANRYGWKPYLGETVSLTAHHRINGLLNGHITASFTDANMNSYSDGKAEASVSLFPNVDISPARGVNINVGISMTLENFSDRAVGWWSDYNSDADFGNNSGEVYYTYPHTFTVKIPISFIISM